MKVLGRVLKSRLDTTRVLSNPHKCLEARAAKLIGRIRYIV